VVVSWRYDYYQQYKHLFKNKLVIFCTVGQSDRKRERNLVKAKNLDGIKIVRVMPAEARYPEFAGADKFVSVWVDYDEPNKWEGQEENIVTVKASLLKRKAACNTDLFLKIVKDLPFEVYGYGNEEVPFCKGTLTDSEMIEKYRSSRLAFALGSKPAPIVFTNLESMARGCPLVTWGPNLGNNPGMNTYTMHEYIDNGVNGFYSDNPTELRKYCKALLKDHSLAKKIGEAGRQLIKSKFSYEIVKNNWKEFFFKQGIS